MLDLNVPVMPAMHHSSSGTVVIDSAQPPRYHGCPSMLNTKLPLQAVECFRSEPLDRRVAR